MKSPICIQCTVYTHMIGYKRWSKVTYSHEIILWRVRDIYFQERPHFYQANLVCNLDGPKTFDKGKKQIAKHIVIKTIFTYPPPAMTERAAILYITQSETFEQRCVQYSLTWDWRIFYLANKNKCTIFSSYHLL